MKHTRFAVTILLLTLLLGSCSNRISSDPKLLKDLAYKPGAEESGCTIQLHEQNGFVPYLVLTDDYSDNGCCLLLRCSPLEEEREFNENGRSSGYYANSAIDRFLSDCFGDTLSDCLQDHLLPIAIEITSKESLWGNDGQTESIERRIFLLSVYEVSGHSSSTQLKEGKPLAFFESDERRAACSEAGKACSWWLRTPNIWYDNLVYAVNPEGIVDVGGVSHSGKPSECGVRPAFCLASELEIVSINGQFYLLGDTPPQDTISLSAP